MTTSDDPSCECGWLLPLLLVPSVNDTVRMQCPVCLVLWAYSCDAKGFGWRLVPATRRLPQL